MNVRQDQNTDYKAISRNLSVMQMNSDLIASQNSANIGRQQSKEYSHINLPPLHRK